jgi:hypothetical protein
MAIMVLPITIVNSIEQLIREWMGSDAGEREKPWELARRIWLATMRPSSEVRPGEAEDQ